MFFYVSFLVFLKEAAKKALVLVARPPLSLVATLFSEFF